MFHWLRGTHLAFHWLRSVVRAAPPYDDFKKSILAMFCSIESPVSVFPKVEKQTYRYTIKGAAHTVFSLLVPSAARPPPLLWNIIGLQPLSALLRDLADTSARFS